MTCLFCDLVNSVELSERIDPEELRETLAEYHRICTTVVRRFEGYVHDYLGDGIMVYFGFPTAHEDDTQRAVRSALGIIDAVSALSSRTAADRGIELHVRIGIDSGLVVAGRLAPDEGLDDATAVGVTPNMAARLQSLAAPDSVVISAAAYRLIAGFFDCRELGFQSIRGFSQPMAIYQVLHESAARTRLDVAARHGLPPMQGRDDELTTLTRLWARARAGHGAAVLVAGEPGIGKSRLVWALQQHVAQAPDASLIRLACSPYFTNTAFYPVVQLLERLLDIGPEDAVEQRLNKIDGLLAQYGFDLPLFAPLIAKLLAVPFAERYPPLDLPADRQRQLTIDVLVELAIERSRRQPVLVVFEDLHWIDPSSLDLLTQLIERGSDVRQLAVLSFRPEFTPPWAESNRLVRIDLGRLDRTAAVGIVIETADTTMPNELLGQLVGKADGVPLYLEELTKLVVEEGLIQAVWRHPDGPIPKLSIPASLADSLTARLDRLTDAKRVAQLSAVIGRHFSFELLARVAETVDTVDIRELAANVDRLVDAGLIFIDDDQRETSYTFKHALIQDAAYTSLLRTTRRQYHEHIAQALVDHFAATVENAPELLAYHYREAGMAAESVPYWLQAGRQARHASANPEAIAHLNAGLDVLVALPAGRARTGQELEFRLALGPAYMAIRGYASPAVEACYERARELCRELGDTPQLVPVLHGLWTYHIVRSQHSSALALGKQVIEIGRATEDDGLLLQGNMETGWSHFFLGELDAAREHLERVLELYDDDRHASHVFTYADNPATSARSNLAQVLWVAGHVERAVRCSEENLTVLRSLTAHPYSVAFGLTLAAVVRQYRGDDAATRELVDQALALAEAQGLAFLGAMATILDGWVIASGGAVDEGMARMRAGLAAQLATGAELARPYWLCLIAEACLWTQACDDGLELLAEAEAAVESTQERYWEAEIHRLRGEILLKTASASQARAAASSFRRALDIARRQSARTLELRAAVSLARLWQAEGRDREAYDLLAPAFGWFSEGWDTPDLQTAGALLAQLGGPLTRLTT